MTNRFEEISGRYLPVKGSNLHIMCFHFALRGLYSDRVGLLPDEQFDLELCDTVFKLFIPSDSSRREIFEKGGKQQVCE